MIEGLQPRLRAGTPVLPMARGVVDPGLLLAGTLRHGQADHDHAGHDHEEHHHHDHVNGHDHDHHDHAHVAMHGVVVRRPGSWGREQLEEQLRHLIRTEPVLRLKGSLHLEGRRLPLQIQAVGPRLDCWFEGGGESAQTPQVPGLELVVLGAAADAARLEAACADLQPA